MEDRMLNEKESLELIARMIQNTQRKLERGAGALMLVWGYATFVVTLSVWIALRLTQNGKFSFLWFIIPVVGVTGILLSEKRPKEVRTYVDKVVRYIWIVLGGTGFLLSMLSIFSFMWHLPILFIIIIIMGMGSVLTGLVIEFKPLVVGGIAGLLISVAHYLIPGYDIKMLTFALAFVVMYIIPGHILNHRASKQCPKN